MSESVEVKCPHRGETIDPDTCWCGMSIDHPYDDNHSGIPMGCNCYRNATSNTCKHGRTGYCFDCVRERHNRDMQDGKFDDMDEDYVSTPHPSAYYERKEHDND